MKPASLLIALGLLAVLFGPPVARLTFWVGRLLVGAAVLALKAIRTLVVVGGCLTVLLLLGS